MLSKLKSLVRSDNSKVLLGNLSASFFGLITFMLLARILPKHTFGEWAIFVAASGFVDLLRTGLIRQAMVRFITLTDEEDRKVKYQQAAVVLHLITIGLISLPLWLTWVFFEAALPAPYGLFVAWYPLWMLVALPHMMDTWFSHALREFGRMNKIRLWINIGFVVFVAFGFFVDYSIETLIIGNMVIQSVISIFSLARYSAIFFGLKAVSRVYLVQLFRFGKHSLATLTGANLLKSADHMIIGAMMSTEAVAIYAIPLKMMDLIEIPLRGFVMTSFPKLSLLSSRKDQEGFSNHFYQWVGMLSLVFLPAGLLLLALPELFITLLGGQGYEDSQLLLQIFVVAMLLMPLDKYLGMSFDSINAPKQNAIKVWVMVMINIVGDFLAITFFDSLVAVALITVLTLVSGLIAGFIMHPVLHFSASRLFASGVHAVKLQLHTTAS